jgi:hypothetical protein
MTPKKKPGSVGAAPGDNGLINSSLRDYYFLTQTLQMYAIETAMSSPGWYNFPRSVKGAIPEPQNAVNNEVDGSFLTGRLSAGKRPFLCTAGNAAGKECQHGGRI